MQHDDLTPLVPTESDIDRCRSYLRYQLSERERPSARNRLLPAGPAVTISFQTGAGAHEVARRLAELLQVGEPKRAVRWTVFDRELVEKALEEHHLPKALAKHIPEDRRSFIQDAMEELLGLRPPSWVMVAQIAKTILHLVDAGHVILVGRGANFITARMPNVFHARLIASLAKRVERVQAFEHLAPKEAAKFIAVSDRGRGRYARAHFHARIEDDLLYHVVLNTDLLPPPEAAELIAEGARRCFKRMEVP